MSEVNLELLMAMAIVQKVLDIQREMREDIREVKTRLGRLETELAGLHASLPSSPLVSTASTPA